MPIFNSQKKQYQVNMPTSVSSLVNKFKLTISDTIKWGTNINESRHGIYIVTSSPQIDFIPTYNYDISLNNDQMILWMQNAPSMTLNGNKPSANDLKQHLPEFWLQDESIFYIGKAEKQSLQDRVSQYYHHKVGKKSPHKGGYWLKLLSDFNNYYIHLLPTDNSHKIEEQMLRHFIDNVSDETKSGLIDKELCLPFANLQLRSGLRKKHGLKNHYQ